MAPTPSVINGTPQVKANKVFSTAPVTGGFGSTTGGGGVVVPLDVAGGVTTG
jgi:hypothetical protein